MTFRLPKDCLARSSLMVRRIQELASFCTRCSASRWITDESCQKRQNDEVSCDCLSLSCSCPCPSRCADYRGARREFGRPTSGRTTGRGTGRLASLLVASWPSALSLGASRLRLWAGRQLVLRRPPARMAPRLGTPPPLVGPAVLWIPLLTLPIALPFAAAMGIRSSRAGGRADKSG